MAAVPILGSYRSPGPSCPILGRNATAGAPARATCRTGRGGAFSDRTGMLLTVPEVRRLLRLLNEPEEARRRVGLHWVPWRGQHLARPRQGDLPRPAGGAPPGGAPPPPLPLPLAWAPALTRPPP